MDRVWDWLRVAIATIGGGLSWYFGLVNEMFYALIAFVVVDFVVGFVRHIFAEENVSSERRWRRALQKLLIFVLVGIANVIDKYIIGDASVLREAVIFFYLASEGVSILEHAAALGLPIPDKLVKILQDLNDKDADRETDHEALKTKKASRHLDDGDKS
ncbi:phage holin family protein [Eubacteriales bacterium OttesenSCG-928-A19]|nr:phage holin family protein [Eubacteriales bacterium OttesenSCG-928-A19]